MKCKRCKGKSDGSYGSGLFCSEKCARSFSTKAKRKEINKKVSKKLKGNRPPLKNITFEELRKRISDGRKGKGLGRRTDINLYISNKLKAKNTYFRDRLIEEGLLKNECNRCKLKPKWNDKKLILQLHHKDGNHFNNHLDNLEILCPNCHTQTDNFSWRNVKRK